MKPVFGALCLGLALAACGSPTPAPPQPKVDADPVASARALFDSDDWSLIGGKCVAVLELPANAGQAENDAAHRRWRTWLERGLQPGLAAQMVTLNKQTYESTPEPTLVAAAAYCRTKIDEVAPAT